MTVRRERRETFAVADEPYLWLLTFSDCLLLLLTFFVLRFSMSSLKWGVPFMKGHPNTLQVQAQNETAAHELQKLHQPGLLKNLEHFTFPMTVLEESGELSFETLASLRGLSRAVAAQNATVAVDVHTEKAPSPHLTYAVLRQMIDAGVDPQSISAMAYSIFSATNDNQNTPSAHLNPHIEVSISSR